MHLMLKEKEILVSILDEPKTIEEIQLKVFLSFGETRELIRKLIKEKKISREKSFPVKYSVKKELRKSIKEIKRKLDWTELVSDACFVCDY